MHNREHKIAAFLVTSDFETNQPFHSATSCEQICYILVEYYEYKLSVCSMKIGDKPVKNP